ncbi:MAG: DUF1549 domain-containing protein [Gemmataceae bacterium]
MDRFVLARLEAKGSSCRGRPTAARWIRRLAFDLTGLPPSPDEVDAFLADPRADAYERLVDRLLASPAYGERWGRHWLDVARYADTKGYVFQEERALPLLYTYRDYVVGALNADLPYDRFIVEQLAADRLGLSGDQSALAAMGFVTSGRFLNNPHDIIDDRIDASFVRGLMGLTVGCARCHDHKYDPVPMKDYYSLYGVFAVLVEPTVRRCSASAIRTRGRRRSRRSWPSGRPRWRRSSRGRWVSCGGGPRSRCWRRPGPATGRASRASAWPPGGVRTWAQAARKPHPVLSPWLAFAKLPEKEFASRAADLAARVAAKDSQPAVNPLVAKAFEGAPPTSRRWPIATRSCSKER